MSIKSFLIGLFVGALAVIMVVVGFRCRDEVKEAAGQVWAAVKPLASKAWEAVSSLFASLRKEKPQLGANTTSPGETVVQV